MAYQFYLIPSLTKDVSKTVKSKEVIKKQGIDDDPIPSIDNTTYATEYSDADPSTWPDYDNWVQSGQESSESEEDWFGDDKQDTGGWYID